MTTQTTPQSTDTDLKRAAAMADGLRKLAQLIESNPRLTEWLKYPLGNMMAPISRAEQPRPLLADFTRATLGAGGKVDKYYSDGGEKSWAGIYAVFGPISIQVYTSRAEVCERVVVGTEEVTKEVPDPQALAAVPTVTVTETVEKVEWRCTSLLADAPDEQSGRAA